ncbi:MAG: L-threonylcarbamoyladenylate synthase [Calditrichia bacterium]
MEQYGKILRDGGVLLHPTETVYGLAARWDNFDALKKVAHLKQRDVNKPLSIMISSYQSLETDLLITDSWILDICKKLLPGALTLLIPSKQNYPLAYWNQFPEIGIRYPNHELSNFLINSCGVPIITTSANLTGEPPPIAFEKVNSSIRAGVDEKLDYGTCRHSIPSTIIKVDPTDKSCIIVRQGAYPTELLSSILTIRKKPI